MMFFAHLLTACLWIPAPVSTGKGHANQGRDETGEEADADADVDGDVDADADSDADADGDSDDTSARVDADGDGYDTSTDCDDNDASIFPGAPEVCDGMDNDCNGTPDDSAVDALVWYADADSDGYGDPAVSTAECTQPAGYVAVSLDCYDIGDDARPGQTAYFTIDRGDGSYDYDCDGTETHEEPNVNSCSWSTGTPCWTGGWYSSLPACGVAGQIVGRACTGNECPTGGTNWIAACR